MSLNYDVIVIGTGAGALVSALRAHDGGARVGLFEKGDQVGGTSAWSGGMVWIPNNPHMIEAGIPDSTDEAVGYIMAMSNGLIDEKLARELVEAGPEMVTWLEENTPTRFQLIESFPDYHPEEVGGKTAGGRSLECPLYPFDELGEWAARVTRGPQLDGSTRMGESPLGNQPVFGIDPAELERRKERDERGSGQGLIGPLLRACLDRGIEPQVSHAAVELITENSAVRGAVFDTPEGRKEVSSGAVILATGGFERDERLKQAFMRGPLERFASVPTNTGDGLRMVMRVGAALGNMREAWWVPMIDVDVPGRGMTAWMINPERTWPRTIMVNSKGQRFANEATEYNALGAAFHVMDATGYGYANLPAWMIFDQVYLERYGIAVHQAGQPVPDWLIQAGSVEELAERIGAPADQLAATLERWNGFCAQGHDDDFNRGDSAHDRYWGDRRIGTGHESTLGPIDTAPYYAVQMHPGALGTKGGPRTDVNGQVEHVDGAPIDGLYATGNVVSSVMGGTYGGAGGTLAPAMVFGWLAGAHAAESVLARQAASA
ncbi:FAD-binding protein [Nocardioides sp. SYSU DS0651]|uniref:FAD-binding protein n=1 Tax=Nocardioides sp. SYSU DS0651 TaxID=3415955 RepID=UPI003F4BDC21